MPACACAGLLRIPVVSRRRRPSPPGRPVVLYASPNVWASRKTFKAQMSVATNEATAVVTGWLTSTPITSRRDVKRTSGTSANGIPNDSTTWLITSVREGSTPQPTTTSAGSIVTTRRTATGIRRRMKPCITTWPESVREERARPAAEDRLERLVRRLERLDVHEAALVEDARGHDEHGHVDEAGERHREDDVDSGEPHEPPRLLVALGPDAVLQERGVEVDDVRHDRRAQNPDGEEHRLAPRELGDDGVMGHRPERRAEELREIGRHRVHLRLEPEGDRRPPREALPADLRQVAPGGDPELRGERLDEHRHQVRGDDHPEQRVAVLRAAGDVGGEVARVDVGDAGDEGWPEEGPDPEAAPLAAQDPAPESRGAGEAVRLSCQHQKLA